MALRVTGISDFNYVLIEERKNGRLNVLFTNLALKCFPISRDQSSQNKIIGKKYVSG